METITIKYFSSFLIYKSPTMRPWSNKSSRIVLNKSILFNNFHGKNILCGGRRTAPSVSFSCLVLSGKSCPMPVCCPDSIRTFRKYAVRFLPARIFLVSFLSAFRITCSNFRTKNLSVVCLSGRTRTRQNCSEFHCPCPPTSDSMLETAFNNVIIIYLRVG